MTAPAEGPYKIFRGRYGWFEVQDANGNIVIKSDRERSARNYCVIANAAYKDGFAAGEKKGFERGCEETTAIIREAEGK